MKVSRKSEANFIGYINVYMFVYRYIYIHRILWALEQNLRKDGLGLTRLRSYATRLPVHGVQSTLSSVHKCSTSSVEAKFATLFNIITFPGPFVRTCRVLDFREIGELGWQCSESSCRAVVFL